MTETEAIETGKKGKSGKEVCDLVLIFPPAMHPSSPPLGVAALKAYLESLNSCAPVKVFDLNLDFYLQALAWIGQKRLRIKLKGMDEDSTANRILRATRFFQGREGMEAFLEIDQYNSCADIYRRFSSVLSGLFDNFSRRILATLPVPPLVERFFQELLNPIVLLSPKLVGFSILFSQQIYFALVMAKLLKERGAQIVFGGATLSVMPEPERLLRDPVTVQIGQERHVLDQRKHVDCLIVGEGETGLIALGESLNGDWSDVPGLVYRVDGEVRKNPPSMISDLDRLPLPDFSDFDLNAYHSPRPILPYLSSRGCFWGRCAFCTHQKTYLAYREESVEKTVNQLKALQERHGVGHFSFVDEMIHPNRFSAIAKRLLDEDVEICWSAYAKPAGSFHEDLAGNLHRAGLRVLMWGVESGSQRILDLMRKGVHPDSVRNILAASGKAGIWNLVFLLFGFPSETAAEWEATLRFVKENRQFIHALSKSRFVLVEGSHVHKHPEHYGITRIFERLDRDLISIAYNYEVGEGLTQDEIEKRFENQISVLEGYGRSPHFGVFRDHLLLHASSVLHRPGDGREIETNVPLITNPAS